MVKNYRFIFLLALLILLTIANYALAAAPRQQTAPDSTFVQRTALQCSSGQTVESFVKIFKADGTAMTAAELDAYEVKAIKDVKTNYHMVARPGWVSFPADCIEVQP